MAWIATGWPSSSRTTTSRSRPVGTDVQVTVALAHYADGVADCVLDVLVGNTRAYGRCPRSPPMQVTLPAVGALVTLHLPGNLRADRNLHETGSDHSRSFRFETPVRPGSRNQVPRRMLLVNRASAQRLRTRSLSFCWPSRWIACRRRRVLAAVVWGAMAPKALYTWEFRSQTGTQTPVYRCRRPVLHPGQPASALEPCSRGSPASPVR